MSITAKILIALSLLTVGSTTGQDANTIEQQVNIQQTEKVVQEQPVIVNDKYGQVVKVDTDLRLRKEPNLESETLDTLKNGMTFNVLDKSDDWYKVEYNKKTGYLFKDFVKTYNELKNPPYPIYIEPKPKKKEEVINKEIPKKNINKIEDYEVGREVSVELTAYDNDKSCSGDWGNLTAMGTRTRVGVIAAPKNIPLGTKVYIPSLKWYNETGIFSVEDRGGAVVEKSNGNSVIDVWFGSHNETEKFGRQVSKMYILKK